MQQLASLVLFEGVNSARDVLEAWESAVNEGHTEAILALYDESAMLIPTFAKEPAPNKESIRQYFQQLASFDDISVQLIGSGLEEQACGESGYILGGRYYWVIKHNGDTQAFKARFTFVMDLSKPAPILHHHSSQAPADL